MRKFTLTSIVPRALAAVCAAGMCITLAACGGSNDSDSSSKKSDSTSSQSSDTSALKDMKQIPGITATGELGKKPTIAFKTPKSVDNNSYAVLQNGNGAVIGNDDRVCSQGIAISVKDGSELDSTWEKNTPDCSLDLSNQNVTAAYRELLVGRKLNTTIAFGVNDSNSSGTSYIMVLTFVSKSKDYTKATGEEVKDVPANLPKVTRAKDGKPSITMNGYKGSDKLVAQTLIKGKGKTVTNKNTVKVKYTGWLLDGKQFDSSWDKNTTLDADTYSGGSNTVIEGWQQGMVGQTVGSQVLLVIPPDLGYGNKAAGSIPANSTLVFVVDILAAY
ncbi:FKBP-type peptidyl-prolyl cis-trans isomerase [Bifidobacterium leontopitheci]|uniref:peptidylprolyl isomerase n=1 Tax=Bifidobacterium leontopitheci TaxID=2650774 RepID=A0A6I1GS91_9BIFI|nr:FKBP-type peptidyl-prolyl cis-trans isomerase [Bifidobacterium leontopitheci]KAB7791058.1 peptidylprolyl isomerase [Bifidobacterium leontopitheci]